MQSGEEGAVLDLLETAFGLREVFETYLRCDRTLRPEDTLLALHDGRPVSCVQIFTKQVRLRGESVPLGGIGSVGTDPAHRGQGVASQLLRRAEDEMRTRGMALALLFSDRLSFYGRLGWVSVAQTKLALHALPVFSDPPSGGARIRPFQNDDRLRVEELYERRAEALETSTIRDRTYWDDQLRYAGNPDEEFRVVERDGQGVAYARKIVLYGIHTAMEYACEPEATDDLAALLVTLAPSEGPLIVPWAGDAQLEEALRARARRVDRYSDPGSLWRVLDGPRLARLAGVPTTTGDRAVLEALVGGPRAVYWPSDRF
jgi:predicted N-acetyltransferase YhbS